METSVLEIAYVPCRKTAGLCTPLLIRIYGRCKIERCGVHCGASLLQIQLYHTQFDDTELSEFIDEEMNYTKKRISMITKKKYSREKT